MLVFGIVLIAPRSDPRLTIPLEDLLSERPAGARGQPDPSQRMINSPTSSANTSLDRIAVRFGFGIGHADLFAAEDVRGQVR